MTPTLPQEVLTEVMKHVGENDLMTLQRSILVCRHWCRAIVPLLWRKPFHHTHRNAAGKRKLIPVYLACLKEEEKKYLTANDFSIPKSKPALFNYITYLQWLNDFYVLEAISTWSRKNRKRRLLAQLLVNKFITECPKLRYLYIHTLQQYRESDILSKITLYHTTLEVLHVKEITRFVSETENDLIVDLVNLIKSQRALKEVVLAGVLNGIDKLVLSLRAKHSRSLKKIKFEDCDFRVKGEIWDLVSGSFVNLELLNFYGCYGLNTSTLHMWTKGLKAQIHIDFSTVELSAR
ncbi:2142_t:CDS:1 [Paraglomus brasilianum]|uniref:2142_t:CDS:1 n=1 Tax=Paraglomus brasilianum TaxID=144538 RepID=A0A9N9DI17_9GLOM|nr:2142_t:CDS:1 [Paraglomus brasilianum]